MRKDGTMPPKNTPPNRDRAKRIILEIVRQAGDGIGKTKLYKAFWLAHLYYVKGQKGYLSDWPIIRMPNGPGIDEGNALVQELERDGFIRRSSRTVLGPFVEDCCSATTKELADDLPEPAIQAIREAVAFVENASATSLSNLSHDMSRSWRESEDRQELNIYSDLVPDDAFIEQREVAEKLNDAFDEMFR
jgi:hypothetical protein